MPLLIHDIEVGARYCGRGAIYKPAYASSKEWIGLCGRPASQFMVRLCLFHLMLMGRDLCACKCCYAGAQIAPLPRYRAAVLVAGGLINRAPTGISRYTINACF